MTAEQPSEPQLEPDLAIREWVLRYVERHPGCAKRDLRKALRGQVDEAFQAAVERLLGEGRIEDRPDGRTKAYYPTDRPEQPG